jgi:hypothetical protein
MSDDADSLFLAARMGEQPFFHSAAKALASRVIVVIQGAIVTNQT